MPKRGKNGYRDEEGLYLSVQPEDNWGRWTLYWYDPTERDFGAAIHECSGYPEAEKVKEVALACGGQYATPNEWAKGPILWPTASAATKALRAINEALLALEAGKPWPEWAVKAKAAGWTPPEGWTP